MIQLCKDISEIPGLRGLAPGLTLGRRGSSCVVLIPEAGGVVALLDPLGLYGLYPLLSTPAPGWWRALRPLLRVFIFPDQVSSLRAEAPVVSSLLGVDVMVVSVTQRELPYVSGV